MDTAHGSLASWTPGLPADGATIEVLGPPVFTTPPNVATPFGVSSATAAWNLPDWATYAVLWLYSSDLLFTGRYIGNLYDLRYRAVR